MAYRTSKPLHPTEFGDPDKKGTTGMKGTTGVRGSTTKRGVTGAVGPRGSGSGKNPKLQAFQTVKVPSSRTPHSRTGVTGTAHKYSFTGIAHNKSTCTHCNPPKKKVEKLAYPPKAKKLSYYTPLPNYTAPKKVATKASPKKVATKAPPKKVATKKVATKAKNIKDYAVHKTTLSGGKVVKKRTYTGQTTGFKGYGKK